MERRTSVYRGAFCGPLCIRQMMRNVSVRHIKTFRSRELLLRILTLNIIRGFYILYAYNIYIVCMDFLKLKDYIVLLWIRARSFLFISIFSNQSVWKFVGIITRNHASGRDSIILLLVATTTTILFSHKR